VALPATTLPSEVFKFTGASNLFHPPKYAFNKVDIPYMIEVTEHSRESGHHISSEDSTVLDKNTLYMYHLMRVTSEIQPLLHSYRHLGFSLEI
jgi:hypothetical protein